MKVRINRMLILKRILLTALCGSILFPVTACKKDKEQNYKEVTADEIYYEPNELSFLDLKKDEDIQILNTSLGKDTIAVALQATYYPPTGGDIVIPPDLVDDVVEFTETTAVAAAVETAPQEESERSVDTQDEQAGEVDELANESDGTQEAIPVTEEEILPEEEAVDETIMYENEFADQYYYKKIYLFLLELDGSLRKQIDLAELLGDDFLDVVHMSYADSGELRIIITPSYTNEDAQGQKWIYRVSSGGEIQGDKQIIETGSNAESFYIDNAFIDSKGYIYTLGMDRSMADEKGVMTVFSPDGELLFSIDDQRSGNDGWSFSIGSSNSFFSDGTDVYVSTYATNTENRKSGFYVIDTTAKKLGDVLDLSNLGVEEYEVLQSGVDGQIFYANNFGVFGVNLEKEEKRTFLEWTHQDLKISEVERTVFVLSEDHIFLILRENQVWGDTQESDELNIKFYMLAKSESPHIGKKIIQIGGYNIIQNSQLLQAAYNFNQSSKEIRIEIVDYAQDSVNSDDPYREMNLEFLAGNVPDIIFGESDLNAMYSANGIFADLNEFIDKDEDFNRDDFYENILNLGSADGKLYQIYSSFYLVGLAGAKSKIGDREGWTLAEFDSFVNELPDGIQILPPNISYELLLRYAIITSGNTFYDSTSKNVNFDSPEFRDALEFAKKYGKNEAEYQESIESGNIIDLYSMLISGEIVLDEVQISRPSDFMSLDYQFGEPVTVIGFPSLENSGIVCYTDNGLSIAENSSNKEEAWAFVKAFFSKEQQDRSAQMYCMPIRIDSMESLLNNLMSPELDNMTSSTTHFVDSFGEIVAMSEETAQRFRELISRVEYGASFDHEVFSIVEEESKAYFSGSKSADEVIQVLQNRVKTLLNEY